MSRHNRKHYNQTNTCCSIEKPIDIISLLFDLSPLSSVKCTVLISYTSLFYSPACNVLYINSVDMESLTGPQAIAKAISETMAAASPPTATVVHFKVSPQGITLTDNQRK